MHMAFFSLVCCSFLLVFVGKGVCACVCVYDDDDDLYCFFLVTFRIMYKITTFACLLALRDARIQYYSNTSTDTKVISQRKNITAQKYTPDPIASVLAAVSG